VVTTDTSMVSKENGMEISGFFGANTFQLLIMHVDYRDGLLKFEIHSESRVQVRVGVAKRRSAIPGEGALHFTLPSVLRALISGT